MRVVVTGGAGFIGANLCRALTRQSWVDDVLALDDLSTGFAANLDDSGARLIEASILDCDALDSAFRDASAIVHLAARPSVPKSVADPVTAHHVNTTGTMNVLESMRRTGCPHLVVASSSSVYGATPRLPKHEGDPPMPRSPYAATKLATEAYVHSWARCFGLDVLVFRFFGVYGPRQAPGHAYAAAIPAFLDAALHERPIVIHGDGHQTRDFTFVDTVVEVLADAVRRTVTRDGPVNLALGSRTSILDVARLVRSVTGSSVPIEHGPPRPGDIRHSQADARRLRDAFPDVTDVPLEQGISATFEWMSKLMEPTSSAYSRTRDTRIQ